MEVTINFDQIQVKSMDSSSGIFVGQINHAYGWNSQSKSNMGFGKIGDHNVMANIESVVYDDDHVDAPMINKSVLTENKEESGAHHSEIKFAAIEVGTMDTNATVSVGESSQAGWSSQAKSNYGNGTFVGDSVLTHNKSIIKDDDVVDSPVNDQDRVSSSMIQQG
ncbi:spore germination protein [Paenibacillus hexagrammi]|uniref:Spore germination protein n=1 Tax=Paenibacillus hexagrammi TaxID=2908839 RepID=A0ABY3SIQ7_9BACL|nr:spore germination protein [Paenibacillus sp. YPD9-1]UJF32862.1 spore germination protein [Paenibacillus sp. YPD9-1]